MRKLKFTLPAIILFSIVFYLSCRRSSDIVPNNATDKDQIAAVTGKEDRFLSVSDSTSPLIKGLAEAIVRQNQQHHFFDQLIQKAGYPNWDKAMIVTPNGAIANRETAKSSMAYMTYIPFVKDSARQVNAILMVKVTGVDTNYKLLYGRQYANYGFNKADDKHWSARDIFHLFTSFDHALFGHTAFIVKDGRLFDKEASERLRVTLQTGSQSERNGNSQNCTNCMMTPVTDCDTYLICVADGEENDGGGSGGTLAVRTTQGTLLSGKDDNCNSVTSCTTYWVETDGGGGVYSGGAGGGGYNWYDENPCDGIVVGGRQMPCDGSGNTGWEPVPGGGNNTNSNGYYYNNVSTLTTNLVQNPLYLVNPCNYLSQYLSLANFQVPQPVIDRVAQVNQAYRNSPYSALVQYTENPCYLQNINDASSAVVNFDYFPIHITALPKDRSGIQMTPQQLFECFRLHWNDFIDVNIASFAPYHNPIINDEPLWNSSNPLTAMLHLNMVFDGTVIVSNYQSIPNESKMIVTTVRTPLDGEHPVSGNRSWGIIPDQAGGYTFFTSGVDRVTGIVETVLNTWAERIPLFNSGFKDADNLWTSLQNKMIQFIEANGGHAERYASPNYILRPKWEDIDSYLKNKITLDELRKRIGC